MKINIYIKKKIVKLVYYCLHQWKQLKRYTYLIYVIFDLNKAYILNFLRFFFFNDSINIKTETVFRCNSDFKVTDQRQIISQYMKIN